MAEEKFPYFAPEDEELTPTKKLSSNVLAIAGFVILVVIVAWGLVHLVTLASPWFSSLFTKPAAAIQVTAPKEASSGEPVAVSWDYAPSTGGMYAFLYECKTGFEFKIRVSSQNDALMNMPCGAAFTVGNATGTISVVPMLSATSSMQVPFSILFIPSTAGAEQAQGNASITVSVGGAPAPVVNVKQTTSGTKKPTPSTPRSSATPADLVVHILAIGTIDSLTGVFINHLPTSPSDMVAVQFDIANDGGSSTGAWYFDAQLPTRLGYAYHSPMQEPLGPGDHIVNTLRFTQGVSGGGVFGVTADPQGLIRESDKSNNTDEEFISMPAY